MLRVLTYLMTSFLGLAPVLAAPKDVPFLAVVNKADATLSLINLETKQTEFSLGLGYLPHEVLSSADGQQIFVSNYGKDHVRSTGPQNIPGNTLTVIHPGLATQGQMINLGLGVCAPHGLASSVDARRIYVTCEDEEQILVLDAGTGQILAKIKTEQAQSHMLVVNSDESRAYVANFSPGTVTVLDLKNHSILAQIAVGPGTEGISLDPSGRFVYATSVLGKSLVKIDTQSLQVIARSETGRSPVRVVPTPDGKKLVVNNSADGSVQIFDALTLTLLRTIPVGRQPVGLVVASSHLAYTAPMLDNEVVVVDLDKMQVIDRIKTGKKPDGLSFFHFRRHP